MKYRSIAFSGEWNPHTEYENVEYEEKQSFSCQSSRVWAYFGLKNSVFVCLWLRKHRSHSACQSCSSVWKISSFPTFLPVWNDPKLCTCPNSIIQNTHTHSHDTHQSKHEFNFVFKLLRFVQNSFPSTIARCNFRFGHLMLLLRRVLSLLCLQFYQFQTFVTIFSQKFINWNFTCYAPLLNWISNLTNKSIRFEVFLSRLSFFFCSFHF